MLTTVAAGRVFDYSHCMGMYSTSGIGFLVPMDFALGSDNTVYVLNRGVDEITLRISKCTLNHEFITDIGRFGMGDGQFVWPMGIALDANENIYVSDENTSKITVMDEDGEFLAKWGEVGTGEGQLRGPAGIAVDGEGNLLVVDSQNNRVQKFTRPVQQALGPVPGRGRLRLRGRLEERPRSKVLRRRPVPSGVQGDSGWRGRFAPSYRRRGRLGRRRLCGRLGQPPG